jgi:hypothetical protein
MVVAAWLLAGAACSSTPSVTTAPLPESERAGSYAQSAPERSTRSPARATTTSSAYDLDLSYDPATTAITRTR